MTEEQKKAVIDALVELVTDKSKDSRSRIDAAGFLLHLAKKTPG